jgi:hypothetical protein
MNAAGRTDKLSSSSAIDGVLAPWRALFATRSGITTSTSPSTSRALQHSHCATVIS